MSKDTLLIGDMQEGSWYELFLLAQEDCMYQPENPVFFIRLQEMLQKHPEAVFKYVEFMEIAGGLNPPPSFGDSLAADDTSLPDTEVILRETLEAEEAIEQQRQKEQARSFSQTVEKAAAAMIEKIRMDRQAEAFLKPKKQRVENFLQLGAIAALIIIALSIVWVGRRSPQSQETSVAVATVAESINAKWGNMATPYEVGSWLYTSNEPIWLQEGLVKVRFDHGTEVILEAPCEFNFLSADKMKLDLGRLCAKVTPKGHGFTVEAPGCSIVDLGTEFGIIATVEGTSEAHVLDGQVELWEEKPSGRSQISYRLQKGQVGSFNRGGNVCIEKRFAQPMAFIREMPKENRISVPGKILDLADIVGGGNGFGTGRLDQAIDPETGEQLETYVHLGKNGTGIFALVAWSPYIDGVFTFGSSDNKIQINSSGYRHAFGLSHGRYYAPVLNVGNINRVDSIDPVVIQGVAYGSKEHPAISLHSDLGITFDLQALRNHNPLLRITRFEALCAINEYSSDPPKTIDAEYWIFLDNHLAERFIHYKYEPREIRLEIPDGTNFLTLVCTRGKSNYGDWSIFARPILVLEPR